MKMLVCDADEVRLGSLVLLMIFIIIVGRPDVEEVMNDYIKLWGVAQCFATTAKVILASSGALDILLTSPESL